LAAVSTQTGNKDAKAGANNQDALAKAKAVLSAEKKVKTLTGFLGQGGGISSGLSSGNQTNSFSQFDSGGRFIGNANGTWIACLLG
jgi:hypothetical protein